MTTFNTPAINLSSYIETIDFVISSNDKRNSSNNDISNTETVIDQYLPPMLIVIGAISNILVIKIMRSVFFRFVSTSFFILVTSVLDVFSLLVLLTVHWINANFPEIMYRGEHAHVMCKIFNFTGWGTSDLGIILTVAMTTERALAILFPMKAHRWCTVKKAKEMFSILTLVIIIKDFHFLITSDMTPATRRDLLCFVSPSSKFFQTFWTDVWPYLHNGFLLVSFSIIMISNFIIIRHIRESDKIYNSKLSETKQNYDAHNMSKHQRGHSKRRQIAIMLLVDSFTIVICTLPFSVFVTLESNSEFLNSNWNEKQIRHLISSLGFYLLYVNRCCNFFLYCISGRRFRKALTIVVCRWRHTLEERVLSDNFNSKKSSTRPANAILSVSQDVRNSCHSFSTRL